MDDRTKAGLRGPVSSCREDVTTFIRGCSTDGCDLEPQERTHWTITRYRRDGRNMEIQYHYGGGRESTSFFTYDEAGRLLEVETCDAGGGISKSIHSYDGSGRLLRVIVRTAEGTEKIVRSFSYEDQYKARAEYLPPTPGQADSAVMYNVEGSDAAVSAPGATSLTTVYNDQGRPVETVFHDSQKRAVSRVTLRYDEAGRMVEESQVTETEEALPAEMQAQLNPAQLQTVRTMFGFGEGGPRWKRVHRYDSEGRRVETVFHFGALGGERKTTAHNDHGDICEERTFRNARQISIDDQGRIVEGGEMATREVPSFEARFSYQYDEHGNWVERDITTRSQPDKPFVVSSVERRSLTYFPA